MGKALATFFILMICSSNAYGIFLGISETCRRDGVPEQFQNFSQERANQLYWWLRASVVLVEGSDTSNGRQACFSFDQEAFNSANPYPELWRYAQTGCIPGLAEIPGRETFSLVGLREREPTAVFCNYLNNYLSISGDRSSADYSRYTSALPGEPEPPTSTETGVIVRPVIEHRAQ